MTRDRRDRIVIWFTAAGFLFLGIDVALGHLTGKLLHPAMWLPLVFLPCAAVVAAGCAIRATPRWRRLFRLVCGLAILIGLLGVGFHVMRLMKELKGTIQWEVLLRLMRYPPVFAPLSVSGLGILGLLVVNAEEREP